MNRIYRMGEKDRKRPSAKTLRDAKKDG